MTKFFMSCVLLLPFSLLASPAVHAQDATDNIRRSLARTLPDVDTRNLKESALPGLYELVVGTRLVFVSADGRYMLMGDLIDLERNVNVSAVQRAKLVSEAIEAVGERNMIVIAPAKPKRTITVFTDVDCPYCAKLHLDVPELNRGGIKVRYVLYPRSGPGSDTYKRSVAVWCAEDRVKAVGIAKAGGKIAMKTCTNPVDRHVRLGEEVGVEGTPTIVLDDGRVLSGYVPAPRLLGILGLGEGQGAGSVAR